MVTYEKQESKYLFAREELKPKSLARTSSWVLVVCTENIFESGFEIMVQQNISKNPVQCKTYHQRFLTCQLCRGINL